MLKKLNLKSNRLLIIAMVVLIATITGALTFYFHFIQEDAFRIDPEVVLDPEQEYQITYWDYPLFIGQEDDYAEFLEGAIAEFNDMYPNIKVNYQLLSFVEGEKNLQEKIDEGNPPDIYHDIFGSRFLSEDLQIPVNIYFEEEEVANYHRSAIEALYADRRIWGLPNWVLPQLWLGNEQLLSNLELDLSEIKAGAWDWQQFSQLALEFSELNRNNSIIFNPHNPQLLFQLLNMEGRTQLFSQEQGLLLELGELESVFGFLNQLRAENVFPTPVEEMNKKLLADFWESRAALIAPVNMWLLNNSYQREAQSTGVNLSLLPPPASQASEDLPLEVVALLLFRQAEYQGHEHTKASYKFAEFINQQKNLFIAEKLKVVPAYLPLQSLWSQEVDLRAEIRDDLLNYSRRVIPQRVDSFASLDQHRELEELLIQAYYDFWLEEASVEEVVDGVMKGAEQLLRAEEEE